MSSPEKDLNNSVVINTDNNETHLIPNGTTLKEKEASGKITRLHQCLRENC